MTWHVVRVQSNAEDRIESAIKEAMAEFCPDALEIYIPRETRMRTVRHGRTERREPIKRPLFPGYLLINVGPDIGFHVVKEVDGVHGFIGRRSNARPWELAEADVKRFRIAEAAGLFDFTPKRRTFTEGQEVRVCKGPFTGFKAKFMSAKPDDRVRVLMQSLIKGGAEREAEMRVDQIEAVKEPQAA